MAGDPSKDKEAKTTRLQIIGLVLLLFALMSTSLVTGLIAAGVVSISSSQAMPVNSLSDAMYVCDHALKDEHGDKLQSLTLDDHSSRSDDTEGVYKLYYELSMYRNPKQKSGVNNFFVNCFVNAKGRVQRMDLYEERQFVPKAIRRTHGNAFGM